MAPDSSAERARSSPPARAPAAGVRDERPQLVYFFGRQSGLSRRVDGYLSQILQRHHNHDTFKVIRVPVDDYPELAAQFEIGELPTILVLVERHVRVRIEAPRGRPAIEHALSPWLR